MVSRIELAIRIGVFLLVLVGAPLFFVLLFRTLDYLAMDDVIDEYREGARATDVGRLNARYEGADDGVLCPHCGAANGEDFRYCHTCQADLGAVES
ncbi:zinc ribbon domain-containing protein [Halomicrobium salinisoli]|uniref:zinc ribbon domain-containing protein n=1 Tax=Halomicrobium salinisoli TaxID=2878391 RepID=UPI001CF05E3D|nr:zinc ribbon domain-containing protein [Halomicrobium salinisoli]